MIQLDEEIVSKLRILDDEIYEINGMFEIIYYLIESDCYQDIESSHLTAQCIVLKNKIRTARKALIQLIPADCYEPIS